MPSDCAIREEAAGYRCNVRKRPPLHLALAIAAAVGDAVEPSAISAVAVACLTAQASFGRQTTSA